MPTPHPDPLNVVEFTDLDDDPLDVCAATLDDGSTAVYIGTHALRPIDAIAFATSITRIAAQLVTFDDLREAVQR